MRQLFITVAVLLCVRSYAQKPDYPQDFFRNPLDIPILLAGNFGECRPGHFHSGLDIKTAGVENQKVHAAANGYISRIKMDKGGFGHALYITHPNGYTTLYAHLNDFAPIIQMYLKKEQYEKKHWDVDIQLSPTLFPVKKGQLIAYSGNTGSSTAPHLHFEIRNTKTEHPLNPQLFGLKVEDHVAPVPKELAFYTGAVLDRVSLDESIYEGEVDIVQLTKSGSIYKPLRGNSQVNINKDTIILLANIPDEKVGIGINIDDHMERSDNTITFYTAELFMDDELQARVTLDDIGYDESRYINAYTDYKSRRLDHKWIQCLFRLPGNRLSGVYSNLNAQQGRLSISNENPHAVRIVVTDDGGNTSTIKFYLRPEPAASPVKNDCNLFLSDKVNSFQDSDVSFSLDARQLYDNICFNFKSSPGSKWSSRCQIHVPEVPIHHYFDLRLRASTEVPVSLRSKMVMKYTDSKDEDGRAAVAADGGWYSAKVRNFGTYWLDIDTTAPVIKSSQKDNSNLGKARQITFEIKDDMTSVKTFSGYLDGKWICFEQHGDMFFYKFDEHCPKGKHKLVFKAADENSNEAEYQLNFIR